MIAKCAHGFADDLISSSFLAFQGPKLIVPAMHTEMIENPIVQNNLNLLKEQGCYILGPISGELACNDKGPGRMIGIDSIVNAIEGLLHNPSLNSPHQKLLITAGGTQEAIDSVRSLTNQASGQLGTTLATLAALDGKDVTLISTTSPEDLSNLITHIHVKTAEEMEKEVIKAFPKHDSLFMTAAVSDFKCATNTEEKLSRHGTDSLALTQTNDILKTVAATKKTTQTVIGFCLEHENKLDQAALKKATEKQVDFLIANTPNNIGSSTRDFQVYTSKGPLDAYKNKSVVEAASIILTLKSKKKIKKTKETQNDKTNR
jgi:phosphopantothenoylcysteine decarboxylase / phosphopantothenate---cysteine ligase